MKEFGESFKALRLMQGLKQKDCVKIFNVSAAAVSNWEAGRKLPEVPMLIRIAEYFDVSLDYLVGRGD